MTDDSHPARSGGVPPREDADAPEQVVPHPAPPATRTGAARTPEAPEPPQWSEPPTYPQAEPLPVPAEPPPSGPLALADEATSSAGFVSSNKDADQAGNASMSESIITGSAEAPHRGIASGHGATSEARFAPETESRTKAEASPPPQSSTTLPGPHSETPAKPVQGPTYHPPQDPDPFPAGTPAQDSIHGGSQTFLSSHGPAAGAASAPDQTSGVKPAFDMIPGMTPASGEPPIPSPAPGDVPDRTHSDLPISGPSYSTPPPLGDPPHDPHPSSAAQPPSPAATSWSGQPDNPAATSRTGQPDSRAATSWPALPDNMAAAPEPVEPRGRAASAHPHGHGHSPASDVAQPYQTVNPYGPAPTSGAGRSPTFGAAQPHSPGPASRAAQPHSPGPAFEAARPDSPGPTSGAAQNWSSTDDAPTPDPYGFSLAPSYGPGPRIEPTPKKPRSHLLLPALAGLLAGLLIFGTGGWFLGRSTATPAPTPVQTATPLPPATALPPYEQNQVAINQPKFTGPLSPLAQGWLPQLSGCVRSGESAGPVLNKGEKVRVRCELDAMSVIFVEYATVADRDKARVKTLGQNVDARSLTPGAAAAREQVTPSGRLNGNYVEYAYQASGKTVSGIWWDDSATPVAAYLLAYWKDGAGQKWEPMRDVWARYA